MPTDPELELARSAFGSHVEVRRWTWTGRGPRSFSAAAHTDLELAWVERGAVRYRIGAREQIVEPGRVFFVPPGVEHETGFLSPVRGIALGVSAAQVETIARRLPAFGGGFVLGDGRPLPASLATLCRWVAAEADGDAAGREIIADALLDVLLVELLRHRGRRCATLGNDRRVASVITRMHAEYAEPLSVADLARAAGMSRFHFARLFRRNTGKSPRDYLQEVRLAEAARRLEREHESIAAVAVAVGIGDAPRFSRQFRRAYGVAPAQYRRGARGRQ